MRLEIPTCQLLLSSSQHMADLPVSVFACLHLVIVQIITNMTSDNLIFCGFNVLDIGSHVYDGLALLLMCWKTVEMFEIHLMINFHC